MKGKNHPCSTIALSFTQTGCCNPAGIDFQKPILKGIGFFSFNTYAKTLALFLLLFGYAQVNAQTFSTTAVGGPTSTFSPNGTSLGVQTVTVTVPQSTTANACVAYGFRYKNSENGYAMATADPGTFPAGNMWISPNLIDSKTLQFTYGTASYQGPGNCKLVAINPVLRLKITSAGANHTWRVDATNGYVYVPLNSGGAVTFVVDLTNGVPTPTAAPTNFLNIPFGTAGAIPFNNCVSMRSFTHLVLGWFSAGTDAAITSADGGAIAGDGIVCSGSGAFNLTAPATASGLATYTYSWSPGGQATQTKSVSAATLLSTTPSQPDVYTVTIGVSSFGCTVSPTKTITTYSNPTAAPTATTGPICAGTNIQLTANASGGSGSYTYAWTGSGTITNTNSANPVVTTTALAAGTYAYTVSVVSSNGSCSSGNITAAPSTFVSKITGSATKTDAALCGGNGSLNLTIAGGHTGNYNYAITGGTNPSGGPISNGAVITVPQGTYTNIAITNSTGVTCSANLTGTPLTVGQVPTPVAPAASPNGVLANALVGSPGAPLIIPDASITALTSLGGFPAASGRIFGPSAWTASTTSNASDWIKFDLGSNKEVTGIATQGKSGTSEWVKTYTAQYSLDDVTYFSIGGTLTGNTDATTVVVVPFSAVIARYIKITPVTINVNKSMRVEIIGPTCSAGTIWFETADVANGNTSRWYDSPSGGTLLATGKKFSTSLNSNTTFYVTNYSTTSTCESGRTAVTGVTIASPATPTVSPDFSGCGQTSILAVPGAGAATCRIYLGSVPGQTTGGTLKTTGTTWPVTIAGTYYYYVTSYDQTTSCESPGVAVTVTVSPSFTYTINTTNINCFGQSTGTAVVPAPITGGTPPFSFSWSGGITGGNATNDTRTGFSAGSYSLTISDAGSCQTINTFSITEPAQLILATPTYTPTVNGEYQIACSGGTTTLGLQPSGGTTPYTYTWSPSGANSPTRVVSAGTYSVTLTDTKGCSTNDTYVVTQPPAVNATTSVDYDCNSSGYSGASVTINGAGGVTPYMYSFNNGAFVSSNTFTAPGNGTFNYVARDANLCTKSGTVAVSQIGQAVSSSDACNTVYVALGGGGTVGSKECPTSVVTGLTLLSSSTGRTKMIIRSGTYVLNQTLNLPTVLGATGFTVEGGYQVVGGEWVKNSDSITVFSMNPPETSPGGNADHKIGISGVGVQNFTLQDLTINVTGFAINDYFNGGYGKSVYGIYLSGCSGYNMVRCVVTTGNASSGLSGTNGTNGGSGSAGGNGPTGDGDNENLNFGTTPGGSSPCCPGGFGGSNSWDQFTSGSGQGGCGGAAGGSGGGDNCNTFSCSNPGSGGSGQNGANGTAGVDGAAGGAFSFSSYFIPGVKGGDGTSGTSGGGGGGGGGGGAEYGTTCNDGSGSAGGGGGGAGCAGTRGLGGYGGGSSYGVFVVSNTGGNLNDCTVSQGALGAGGTAGTGGTAGSGAPGGSGGGGGCSVGAGGHGGSGGNGGRGGNGGAGVAGESVAVRTVGVNGPFAGLTGVPGTNDPVTVKQDAGCTNSEIILTKGSGTFTLPTGASFINNLNSTTTSYTTSSSSVGIYFPTAASLGKRDVVISSTYKNFLDIRNSRSLPTFTVSNTNPCEGDQVTLTATSAGGNPSGGPIIYEWQIISGSTPSNPSSGVTNAVSTTHAFATAGPYEIRLRVKVSCCGWSIPVYIPVTVRAYPAVAGAINASDNIVCSGQQNVTYSISAAANATSYVWTVTGGVIQSGQGTTSIVVNWSTPTTGSVKVLPTNSCGDAASITTRTVVVNSNPTATITPSGPTNFCHPGSVTLQGGGSAGTGGNLSLSFQWSTGATTTNLAVAPPSPGSFTYTLTVTEGSSGCSASNSAIINDYEMPQDRPASAAVSTICNGGSTSIQVTNSQIGFNYQLRINASPVGAFVAGTGGTILLPTGNLSTGSVTFNVLSSNASLATCGLQLSTSPVVTVVADPAVTISADATNICVGGTVNFTSSVSNGTGTCSLQWQRSSNNIAWTDIPSATGSTLAYGSTESSSFYVRVMRTCTGVGCDQAISSSILINVFPDPSISITGGTQICRFTSTTLSASVSGGALSCTIQWQTSADGIGGWTNIPGANGVNYNTGSLDVTTFYRATYSCTGSGCGPATSNVQAVVIDVIEPVASCQDITVQLSDGPPEQGSVSITPSQINNGSTDNCTIDYDIMELTQTDFSCFDVGTPVEVTLTVYDNNNNSATCTAVVTVEDNTPPLAQCGDFQVSLDDNGEAVVSVIDLDAGSTDNCGIANIYFDDFTSDRVYTCNDLANLGVNAATIIVEDVHGLTTECTSYVTVVDETPPVANCQDITVQLDGNGEVTVSVFDIDALSTDNCGIVSYTLDRHIAGDETVNTYDCASTGPNTLVLTVTDASGNSYDCSSTVTVLDDFVIVAGVSLPHAECSGDINNPVELSLNSSGTYQLVPADVDNGSIDNCGFSLDVLCDSHPSCMYDCNDAYGVTNTTYEVTLIITDASNNTDACNTWVKILDDEVPVTRCKTITLELDAVTGEQVVPIYDDIPNNIYGVDNGSTDNCGILYTVVPGTVYCSDIPDGQNSYTIPFTLTVTDLSGNSSSCTSTVVVRDNVAPDAQCQDVTVVLDANGNGTITATQVDDGSSDACGIASMVLDDYVFNCGEVGDNIVTLTVTDNKGNISSCTSTITVIDNIPPVARCVPDFTLQLDASGQASITTANIDNGSSDACGPLTLALSNSAFTCASIGPRTVTLTVTDFYGNSSTCSTVVTVQDHVAPAITCPYSTIVAHPFENVVSNDNGQCGATVTPINLDSKFDACGIASISNTKTGNTENAGGLFPVGTTTVTYTVTDVNGNASSCDFKITVQDNEPPVIHCPYHSSNTLVRPTDVGQCYATIVVPSPQLLTDNCAVNMSTLTNSFTNTTNASGQYPKGMTAVTWQIHDIHGNVSSCTDFVFVLDMEPPHALCQNLTVNLDNTGSAVITPAQINNGSSDNCTILSYAISNNVFNCASRGPNGVTLTVTDGSGNVSTCNSTVNVVDNTPPTALCRNQTLFLDGNGQASVTAADVNNGSSDNCHIASLVLSQTAFTCAHIGNNTVTLTVTDDASPANSSTCNATITVIDNQNPVAVCHNVTVSLDATGHASITGTQIAGASTDNCAITSYVVSPNTFNCSNISTTNTVLALVTDQSGHSSSCNAVVTVVDDMNPVITSCPPNVTINCQDSQLPANTGGSATATDNCDQNVAITHNDMVIPGFCAQTFTIIRTWTATDDYNNSSSCVQVINVQDVTAPTITFCPASVTVNCQDATDIAALGNATGTDICSAVHVSHSDVSTQALSPSTCGYYNYTITRTFTVADDCSNASTCVQVITVHDVTSPAITAQASNQTVECNGSGNSGQLNNWLMTNGGTGAASDICSGVTWSNNFSALSDGCGATGSATVTFRATDVCGNYSETTATFTIEDHTTPTITAAATNLTVECDGAGNTTQLNNWLSNNGGTATAEDICSGVTWTNNFTALTDGCSNTGSATVTFRATDDCGNFIETTAVFTIEDHTDPYWTTAPADLTVECDGAGNTAQLGNWLNSFSGDDVCGSATVTNNFTGLSDDCGNTGTATVTFTLTDECGNDITADATFTIIDVTDPYWTAAPADLTVECDGAGNTAQLNAWLNSFAGDDVCGSATVTNNFTGLSDDCGNTGTATVTFTLTDECGNDITADATFTIIDVTDPYWTNAPANLTVECDGAGNTAQLGNWLNSFSGDDVCGSATVTNNFTGLSDDCGNTGTATVTFTLTDECGNDITADATFTIIDVTDPYWTAAPADLTVECDGAGNTAQLNAWLNSFAGDDVCGSATVTNNFTGLSDDCGNTGTATVTFTLTDECGNDITADATFTIIDVTDPYWTNAPANLTVECDGAGNTTQLSNWLNSFAGDDVCGSATVTNNFTGLSDDCGNTGTATVTFTLTDECGNDITADATFTIIDVTDPYWTAAPADLTVECDGAGNTTQLNNWLNSFAGDDVCGSATVTNNFTGLSDDCGNTGTATVTFTLTDECGNDITADATFTIIDVTDPYWTAAPADLTVECDGAGNTTQLNNWLNSFAGDDVCGSATVTNNFTGLSDDCGNTGTATVTFTLTDECGNDITADATFTIIDVTDPYWTAAPADLTVECDGAGNTTQLSNWLNSFAGDDVCGSAIVTNNFTGLSDDCGNTGTATVTFTLTDECGNDITADATFTIIDVTDPYWTAAPANLTVECDGAGNTTQLSNWLNSFAGDDVCGSATVTNNFTGLSDDCGNTGTATVTFTLTDECGNDITADATFTIIDVTDPYWTAAPADLTVECDGAGNITQLNNWLNSFAGDDVCGSATVTNNFTGLSDDCGNTGTAMVTFTLTDECGNDITADATFTIIDVTDPYWTAAPADLTVECDGAGNTTQLNNWLNSFAGDDVCGSATVTNNFTGLSDDCGNTGTATVTFTLTDECGNNITADATFTIIDVTDPYWTNAPANLTVECDGAGNTTQLSNWLNSFAGDDVCGSATVTNNFTGLSDDCGNTGTATVTFTLTDECGNDITADATFTIIDVTDPYWTAAPADLTVECDGAGNTTQLSNWLNSFAGDDVCGSATVTNNFTGLSDDCGNTGTATVTFTLTDECGNDITADATFTIIDVTDPYWTAAPADLTVECDGAGNTAQLSAWLNSFAGDDVCGSATVTNNFTGLSDDCGNTGTATVTFTLTDECGNDITADATFKIIDVTDPYWTAAPADLTVECDGAGNTTQLNNWLNSFAGDDVCGSATVTNNFTGLSDDCGNTGTATVTFTLTDECGNDITADATFTIIDVTDPYWTAAPADLTVECDGAGNTTQLNNWLNSFAGDDVCGSATVTNNFTGLSDDCGNTGTATVTFTLTDECGNDITADATFTIIDVTDPYWTAAPANLTVECDGAGNTTQLNNWLNSFAGDDVCGSATVTNNFTGLSDDCGNTGTATVTFTLTDECGNDITADATFTIIDVTDPYWTVAPADLTVECDGAGNTTQLNNWLNSFAGDDVCGSATVTNNFTGLSDDCGNTGTATVTFTLTDECGNDITADATFTIIDVTDPYWTAAPADLTVECDGAGNTTQLNNWLNSFAGDDVCGSATVTNNFTGLSDDCGNTGTATVTFTLTDECGNDITADATFTIIDVTDPYWTAAPADLTVECDGAGNTTQLNNWLNSFAGDDVCGSAVVTNNFTAVSDLCGNTGGATVTFILTDNCGNHISQNATFTIVDVTNPYWTNAPANLTVECNGSGNTAQLNAWLNSFSGADVCGSAVVTNNFTAVSDLCGNTGGATVTFILTDNCGNHISQNATFTIVDVTNPYWVNAPSNLTVECNGSGNTAQLNAWLNSFSGADVCGSAVVTNNFTAVSDLCGNTGGATVTFTLTDNCGNHISQNATFTIVDVTNPYWSNAPANMTVECNGAGNTAQLNAWLNSFSGADVCGSAVVTNNYSGLSDLCGNTGSATVTFTLTDNCGNHIASNATFTIVDVTAPVPACKNITIQLNAAGTASITPSSVDNGSSDVCSGVTLTINKSTFDCTNTNRLGTGVSGGNNPVVLTVTDDCGNHSTCTSIVTVQDNVLPVALCHNVTIHLPRTGSQTVTAAQIDNGSNDACGVNQLVPGALNPNTFTCTNKGNNTVTLTVTDNNGNTATCTATVTVTVDPLAITQLSSPTYQCGYNIKCNGDNTGSIALEVAGGCQPYSYSWTTTNGSGVAATSEDQSGLTAGTYNVTITDANGDHISSNITLTQPAPLTNNGVKSLYQCTKNISCNGAHDGSVALTVAGGATCLNYTYDWIGPNSYTRHVVGGPTAGSISGLGAGVYKVLITDANGCIIPGTYVLTQPDPLAITQLTAGNFPGGGNISCNSQCDGTISMTVAGGAECVAYTYHWTGPVQYIPVTTTTTTNTTVTGNVVSASGNASGIANTVGAVNGTVATFDAVGDAGLLELGHEVPAGTTLMIRMRQKPGQAGTSMLTVYQSQYGTLFSATGTTVSTTNETWYDQPVVTTGPTRYVAITATSSSDFEVDAITYSYVKTTTTTTTTTTNAGPYTSSQEDLTGLCAGTYNVTITDASGCSVTGSITLNQATAVATGICGSQTVLFGYYPENVAQVSTSATGGVTPYTYHWSTGETTASIEVAPTQTTTYSVTVTDAVGCSATGSSTVTVVDVRCGSALDQVTMCDGTNKNQCVKVLDVPAKQAAGWTLGGCGGGSLEVKCSNGLADDGGTLIDCANPACWMTSVCGGAHPNYGDANCGAPTIGGCTCEGGVRTYTVKYTGASGVTIKAYANTGHTGLLATFNSVANNQLLTVTAAGTGTTLNTYTYFEVVGTTPDVAVYTGCGSVNTSGTADLVVSQTGVATPTNVTGAPNSTGAIFTNTGNVMVVRLANTLPAGTLYKVYWKKSGTGTASMKISESMDNVSYAQNSGTPAATISTSFVTVTLTAGGPTKYLKIESLSATDFYVDAVTYSYDQAQGPGMRADQFITQSYVDLYNNTCDGTVTTCDICAPSGHVKLMQVKYVGASGATIRVRDYPSQNVFQVFTNVQNGEELVVNGTYNSNGGILNYYTYLETVGSSAPYAIIPTDCNNGHGAAIIGRSYGVFQVEGLTDVKDNTCGMDAPCLCSGGISFLGLTYDGPNGGTVTAYTTADHSVTLGTFGPLQTGDTIVIRADAADLYAFNTNTYFTIGGYVPDVVVPTSCGVYLKGMQFSNMLTVFGWIDKEEHLCNMEQQPLCPCYNGVKQVVIEYEEYDSLTLSDADVFFYADAAHQDTIAKFSDVDVGDVMTVWAGDQPGGILPPITYVQITAAPSFNVSGNVTAVTTQSGVGASNESVGAPNGTGASYTNTGNYQVLDFGSTLPAGATYTIYWKRSGGTTASMKVSESSNGTTFTQNGGTHSTTSTTFVTVTKTTMAATRYIKIESLSSTDFFVDAVTYTYTVYQNTASRPDIKFKTSCAELDDLVGETVRELFVSSITDGDGNTCDNACGIGKTLMCHQTGSRLHHHHDQNGSWNNASVPYHAHCVKNKDVNKKLQTGNWTLGDCPIVKAPQTLTTEPEGFLLTAAPNPFNESTTIRFRMTAEERVNVTVYNVEGKQIATLFEGVAEKDKVYEAEFRAQMNPDGMYFYRLVTEGGDVYIRKLIQAKQ